LVPWLKQNTPFPAIESALQAPNGLLAAGADLSPQRLLDAYTHGIFPWYSEGQPIMWWSPNPRMVLVPQEFRPSRSLAKTLRHKAYEVRFDTAFRDVMLACSEPREGQAGTWISPDMVNAYCNLHDLGYAHSVETWAEGKLAGGLYGIAIGKMFYGESMFARKTDASKIALAHLVQQLVAQDFGLIDCQMSTQHLASLGAREIPRKEFINKINKLCNTPHVPKKWTDAVLQAETASGVN
jgi:leucyl/phenylalanyl-tRNA---protein transferase